MAKIEEIVFPNGAKTPNERNDVEIIFNAWKYGRTLITNDGGSRRQPGGILGHKVELKRLDINVVRDIDAIDEIRSLIENRDKIARSVSLEKGEALPDWVGED